MSIQIVIVLRGYSFCTECYRTVTDVEALRLHFYRTKIFKLPISDRSYDPHTSVVCLMLLLAVTFKHVLAVSLFIRMPMVVFTHI